MKKNIWILEDETSFQFMYKKTLELRYQLTIFSTIQEFQDALRTKRQRPDLMLADLRLPGASFVDFLDKSELAKELVFPFIIVSSVDDLDILRLCFEQGASDYLTKPFNKHELIIKMERAFEGNKSGVSEIQKKELDQDFEIDVAGLRFKNSRGKINLTPKELLILSVLKKDKGCPVPREKIVREVWDDVNVGSNTLDVHIFNLRKKTKELGLEIQFREPNSFLLGSSTSN